MNKKIKTWLKLAFLVIMFVSVLYHIHKGELVLANYYLILYVFSIFGSKLNDVVKSLDLIWYQIHKFNKSRGVSDD